MIPVRKRFSNGMISDEPFDIAQGSSRGSAGSPSLEPSRAKSREATSRDERFPKREHLLKTGDFRRVYKEGASFKKTDFILYRLPNALEYNRIGFSINSRDVKLATVRNRYRRRLREIYRRNKSVLKKGFDIILIVKRRLPNPIAYKDIEEIFLELAKRAGLLL